MLSIFIAVAAVAAIMALLKSMKLPQRGFKKVTSPPSKEVLERTFDYGLDGKFCVVVGGSGFLGQKLVRALLHSGCRVRVFDIAERGNLKDEKLEFMRGDLANFDDCLRGVQGGVDVVFHCASPPYKSRNYALLETVNVKGTKNIAEASAKAGVPAFVFTSSASVIYDGTPHEGVDESIPRPNKLQNLYAESKADGEEIVLKLNGKDGLSTIALRPHSIFGPGDPYFLPAILDRVRKGKPMFQIGNGKNVVDFTYVGNVVHSHLLAAKALLSSPAACAGKPYFITNDSPVLFWDMIAMMLQGHGFPSPQYFIPFRPLYMLALFIEAVLALLKPLVTVEITLNSQAVILAGTNHYYSCAAAKRDIDYIPLWTFDEAVRITIADSLGLVHSKEKTMEEVSSVGDNAVNGDQAKERKVYTEEEVAKHNSAGDLWLIVNGRVYDVSDFVDDHPGGADAVLDQGGKDASEGVMGPQHPPTVMDAIEQFYIGDLQK